MSDPLQILDTLGIQHPVITVNNEDGTATINNYPYNQFTKLTGELSIQTNRAVANNKRFQDAYGIVHEWQDSLKEDDIRDEDAQYFSVAEVNRLLTALNMSELELVRKFAVNVTVELSFTVEVEATDEDAARDMVVEEVEMNADWNRALNYISGDIGDVYADRVDGDAELV